MADDFARIQVDGLNQALLDLARMRDKEVPKAIKQANLDAAQLVVPTAKAEAPKGATNKLSDSVRAKATKKAGSLQAGSAVRVPYAGPIHFGWFRRHIQPNPFLYRAVDKRIGDVYRVYVQQMERVIARFNG